ncbi:MAG: amylo-alpha-1,6-glucosidase [Candidatus Paceibacterota bacterium]|jgi:hypothetical protein
MKIIHSQENGFCIEKEVKGEESSFLLTNRIGGYLWFGQEPASRYQGWFFNFPELVGSTIYKALEEIKIAGRNDPVSEIKNNFWSVERVKGSYRESFFLPSKMDALVYEIDRPADLEIVLDVREFKDYGDKERHYNIFKEEGLTVVSYSHPGMAVPEIFLAVRSDSREIDPLNDWLEKDYPSDRRRNSSPHSLYVFKALRLNKARKFSIAVSDKKDAAIKDANFAFDNSEQLKIEKRKEMKEVLGKVLAAEERRGEKVFCLESRVLEFLALYSLGSLLVLDKTRNSLKGIFAGLPWFFQFWMRDEAISLRSLARYEEQAAEEIMMARLKDLRSKNWKSDLSDDAAWWLLLQLDRSIQSKKYFHRNRKELAAIFEEAAYSLFRREDERRLLSSGPQRTWMDSLQRSGARLEVQALRLAVLKGAADHSNLMAQKEYFKGLEIKLREQVRRCFWDGKTLADGFDMGNWAADMTVRPNIFLAAYAYPDLLSKEEWRICFDNILPVLWCDWGGVSSIDKRDPRFISKYTGEDSASYHNGDSWFYLNNIAAIAMQRVDPIHFAFQIRKIFKASSSDLLWKGVIGHISEISSADQFELGGCLSQTWSAATFLELFEEM